MRRIKNLRHKQYARITATTHFLQSHQNRTGGDRFRLAVIRSRGSKFGVLSLVTYLSSQSLSIAQNGNIDGVVGFAGEDGCSEMVELRQRRRSLAIDEDGAVDRTSGVSLRRSRTPASPVPNYPLSWRDDRDRTLYRCMRNLTAGLRPVEVHRLLCEFRLPKRWEKMTVDQPFFRWQSWHDMSKTMQSYPALKECSKPPPRTSSKASGTAPLSSTLFGKVTTDASEFLSGLILNPKAEATKPGTESADVNRGAATPVQAQQLWIRSMLVMAITYVRFAYNLSYETIVRASAEVTHIDIKWDLVQKAASELEEAAMTDNPALWNTAAKEYLAKLKRLVNALAIRMPVGGLVSLATVLDEMSIFEDSPQGRCIDEFFDIAGHKSEWLRQLENEAENPRALRILPFWRNGPSTHSRLQYCRSRLAKERKHLAPLYLFVAALWVSVGRYGRELCQQRLLLDVHTDCEVAKPSWFATRRERLRAAVTCRKKADQETKSEKGGSVVVAAASPATASVTAAPVNAEPEKGATVTERTAEEKEFAFQAAAQAESRAKVALWMAQCELEEQVVPTVGQDIATIQTWKEAVGAAAAAAEPSTQSAVSAAAKKTRKEVKKTSADSLSDVAANTSKEAAKRARNETGAVATRTGETCEADAHRDARSADAVLPPRAERPMPARCVTKEEVRVVISALVRHIASFQHRAKEPAAANRQQTLRFFKEQTVGKPMLKVKNFFADPMYGLSTAGPLGITTTVLIVLSLF